MKTLKIFQPELASLSTLSAGYLSLRKRGSCSVE